MIANLEFQCGALISACFSFDVWDSEMPRMELYGTKACLTITEPDGTKKKAALMNGFLEITPDAMSILAEVAEWPEEIDQERVKKAKERARKRLEAKETEIDVMRAELALKRALVREKMIQK